MFDKTYELSLNRNYVSRWGLAEAVRELIQNALDSASPFVYEFAPQDDDLVTLRLTSEHSTLPVQTLLLGSTSKSDDPDAIGSFGEGYKIALLVLTRLGHEVVVHNGDVDWAPFFKHSKIFNDELLAIRESTARERRRGLMVEVGGLTADDVAAVVASCLKMQSEVGRVMQTTKGDILLERPGQLYVGSLFICKIDANFGYNIDPKHIRLERDRRTVDTFDLFDVTRDMWYETKQFDRIAEMIDEGVPDLQYAKYSAPDMVKEACYQEFRRKNPGAVAAESQEQLKQLVRQGMTNVVVINSGMYSMVSSAHGYRSEVPVRVISPRERLEAFFATHKFKMHEKVRGPFHDLIDEAKNWKLR